MYSQQKYTELVFNVSVMFFNEHCSTVPTHFCIYFTFIWTFTCERNYSQRTLSFVKENRFWSVDQLFYLTEWVAGFTKITNCWFYIWPPEGWIYPAPARFDRLRDGFTRHLLDLEIFLLPAFFVAGMFIVKISNDCSGVPFLIYCCLAGILAEVAALLFV